MATLPDFGTYVDPKTGKKYPACPFCGMKLSAFYAGSNPDDAILGAAVKRYYDHLLERHPEEFRRMTS